MTKRPSRRLPARHAWLLCVPLLVASETAAWAQPPNDNFANAAAVAALPFTERVKFVGADNKPTPLEAGEPTRTNAACENKVRDLPLLGTLWYRYKNASAADQQLVAHTTASTYDTVLAVFPVTGNPAAPTFRDLDTAASLCSDNVVIRPLTFPGEAAAYSQVIFTAKANTTYYFQVGYIFGKTFDLAFRIDVVRNAAVLVNGENIGSIGTQHLSDALRKSPLWSHAPIVQLHWPTPAALRAAIVNTYRGVPATGISLFVFYGHGNKTRAASDKTVKPKIVGQFVDSAPQDEPEEPPALGGGKADEFIVLNGDGLKDDDTFNPAEGIVDDNLGALFDGVTGRRILVFDNCYAAGVRDGTADFPGAARAAVFIFSSSADVTTSYATGTNDFKFGTPTTLHVESWLTGSLITGLSRAGDANIAQADGSDGAPRNGKVTVKEWFKFADTAVDAMRDEWNRRGNEAKNDAQLHDEDAPAGAKADDIVIFEYEENPPAETPKLLLHPGPTLGAPRVEQQDSPAREETLCGEGGRDMGDAPDPRDDVAGRYPTLAVNQGPIHLNQTGCAICGSASSEVYDWLGARVDSEQEADVERDDQDADGDGLDGDAFDDGVVFTKTAPAVLKAEVTVSVADRNVSSAEGGFVYDSNDAFKRLYLNAWADWNRDGVWSAMEKVIGTGPGNFAIDPHEDPQFADDNRATYSFLIPIPPAAAAGAVYFRFRLDYGEDVGEVQAIDAALNQEKGPAQFGEVEDHCLTVVPEFSGESPPVALSTGTLALNGDLRSVRTFRWQSTDKVLGTIDTGVATAGTWNYQSNLAGDPTRLVFVGSGAGATLSGNVLFEPYNRAVVDVVKGGKRVRYLLVSSGCQVPRSEADSLD